MDQQTEQRLIHQWLLGNAEAIDLINAFNHLSQIWDDLYDNDKFVNGWDVNRMMMQALITIPRNRFYREHFADLQPVIEHCLFNWLDANALEENGNTRDLQVSYILRSTTTDLLIHCAYLVGGPEWRLKVAADVRSRIYRDNESFTAYRKEIQETRHVRR